MKRLVVLVVSLILLNGCINLQLNKDVLYIGDSLCVKVFDSTGTTAQDQLGFTKLCKGGRKLTDIDHISSEYPKVFLALGTNDAYYGDSGYREHLEYLLSTTTSKVICVLPQPMIRDRDASEYRQAMLDLCENTIDPHDNNITARARDGIHWTQYDHDLFAAVLRRIL